MNRKTVAMATALLANHKDGTWICISYGLVYANVKPVRQRYQRHVCLGNPRSTTRSAVRGVDTEGAWKCAVDVFQLRVCLSAGSVVKWCQAMPSRPRRWFSRQIMSAKCGSCFIAFPAAHTGTSHDPLGRFISLGCLVSASKTLPWNNVQDV